MADKRLERMIELLKRKGAALRSGRLTEAAAMADELDSLMADYKGGTDAIGDLQEVRRLAARNAGLAAAARTGVETAMERIGAMTSARGPIGSYTETGARQEIGSSISQVERKV